MRYFIVSDDIHFCVEFQIKYTGFRDRSHDERQVRFQAGCREGHAELVSTSLINL